MSAMDTKLQASATDSPLRCPVCPKLLGPLDVGYRFVGQEEWCCCAAHARIAVDQAEGRPV